MPWLSGLPGDFASHAIAELKGGEKGCLIGEQFVSVSAKEHGHENTTKRPSICKEDLSQTNPRSFRKGDPPHARWRKLPTGELRHL